MEGRGREEEEGRKKEGEKVNTRREAKFIYDESLFVKFQAKLQTKAPYQQRI